MSREPALARIFPLPPAGRACYVAVALASVATVTSELAFQSSGRPWLTFAFLAAAAAFAQTYTVRTGNNHGFQTSVVFVAAGALLLPPDLLVAMVVVQHVPEWIKERYPWFIQSFNIWNTTLAALAARAAARQIAGLGGPVDGRWATAGLAAVVCLTLVSHSLLAVMLRFGRSVRIRAGGLLSFGALTGDMMLAGLGVGVAAIVRLDPWLLPAVLAPLVLSHRSFATLGRLRDSEERFHTMFESAPIGIVVRELDGRFVSANRALVDMLGYEQHELALLDRGDLFDSDEGSSEQVVVAKDGREVAVIVNVALVRDAGERPQYVLEMVQDVSEHRLLEEQLRQAQKLEAIGRLAGGVAHDFNNLLTAINGYADLARLRAIDYRDDDLVDDLREITKAGQRAHGLTRQLLAFSRKQILQPQVLNLNDVVGDMDTMLRRVIGEDIEVATLYGSSLANVLADPGQLEQVVVNLVVNARDAMPDGGTLSIETANVLLDGASAARLDGDAGEYVSLTIRDTGTGMDEETMSRMFEPFFTRKALGQGTGLGLATVYGIVKQSGALIDVQSATGTGTTFSIYFPAHEQDVRQTWRAEPHDGAALPGSETILVVEDEDVVRRWVERVLANEGYRVLVAEDCDDALRIALGERIDLLLTDVVMPKMSGRELADRLTTPYGKPRVVFMSGYMNELVEAQGVLEPGIDFLHKPFTVVDVTRKIREVLDRVAVTTAA